MQIYASLRSETCNVSCNRDDFLDLLTEPGDQQGLYLYVVPTVLQHISPCITTLLSDLFSRCTEQDIAPLKAIITIMKRGRQTGLFNFQGLFSLWPKVFLR